MIERAEVPESLFNVTIYAANEGKKLFLLRLFDILLCYTSACQARSSLAH